MNHKLPGFGINPEGIPHPDGGSKQFGLIYQGFRGAAPWVDMGTAIGMGLWVCGLCETRRAAAGCGPRWSPFRGSGRGHCRRHRGRRDCRAGRLDRRESVRLQITAERTPWRNTSWPTIWAPAATRPRCTPREGRLVASRTCPYDTRFFNGNWAEQEPRIGGAPFAARPRSCWIEAKADASGRGRGGAERADDGLHAGGSGRQSRCVPRFSTAIKEPPANAASCFR